MKTKKGKPYPCIETTMDIVDDRGDEYRLWVDENDITGKSYAVGHTLNSANNIIKGKGTVISKLKKIAALPKVNAVQHRKDMGDNIKMGMVIYTVDFENHG